jgi:hypothetical protein
MDIDAAKPARIVSNARPVVQFDRQSVRFSINRLDGSEAVPLDSFGPAAGCVLEYVTDGVPRRLGAVRSGHIGAMSKRTQRLPIFGQDSGA